MVEARIHRFGAEMAQTRPTARGTLTAGGGWSSPHPGGDIGWTDWTWHDWTWSDWSRSGPEDSVARRRVISGYPDEAGGAAR